MTKNYFFQTYFKLNRILSTSVWIVPILIETQFRSIFGRFWSVLINFDRFRSVFGDFRFKNLKIILDWNQIWWILILFVKFRPTNPGWYKIKLAINRLITIKPDHGELKLFSTKQIVSWWFGKIMISRIHWHPKRVLVVGPGILGPHSDKNLYFLTRYGI